MACSSSRKLPGQGSRASAWDSPGRRRGGGLAVLPGDPGHQARDQVGEFVPPLAQGRQGQHRALQAVEQVVAEGSRRRQGLQGPVGGGQEAHVHPQRALGAHPPHLPLLQHPEEQRLQARGDVGHLVQEQGAAFGAFDGAPAVPAARRCRRPSRGRTAPTP